MKEAHREVTGDGDRQTSILHPVDNMVMSKKEKAMAGSNTSTPVSAATSEREKAIEQALSQIERRFGKGAIMRLGEQAKVQSDVIPTGSSALDLALGVGGIPRGRITEIYGPESSGKTTLCQHVIANAQRAGGYAAFIDAEHALDRTYAARCGVDVNNLLISQPDTGEQALEILDALVRSNAIDVVVVDSVAALTPRAEIEGEMGDSHVGLQARLMSQAMRKLAGAISASNTAVLFTNQLREKVGVMFGNPETTSGGKALKFYASVRLDIRRTDTIKQGQDAMGSRTRVRVVKNKVAPPFRVAEFDIMYSEGISREGGLIDLGLEMGLVKKSGAWFNVGDIRLGQGRENAKDFLRQNSDVAQALEEQIRGNIASFKPAEIDLGDDDSGGEEEI
jgi:recombination protein RecA